ncbi:MAG: response regulator [Deltaproteobacteria bacterium]|nr:response regulator [Deltaproteobacteria bacterium]
MSDLARERDYYLQETERLGAKLFGAVEAQIRAVGEAERSRTAAAVLRGLVKAAAGEASVSQLAAASAQVILSTLRVDRVAFLTFQPEVGLFRSDHVLGFSSPVELRFPGEAPAFLFASSKSPADPLALVIREAAAAPFFLWAFDKDSRWALLLANERENQFTGKPFEADDREIMDATLSVFVDVLRRKRAEVALDETNKQLAASMQELKVALEKANEASRIKSEFVAVISHELRTPLNTIVNVPGLLLQHYAQLPTWRCAQCQASFTDDSGAQECEGQVCPDCGVKLTLEERVVFQGSAAEHQSFLLRLRQSAEHLRRMVEDLLDMSKLEARKMKLNLDQFDLGSFVAETCDTLVLLAQERRISLQQDVVDEGRTLRADRVKLAQVLINVLANAIRFTPPEGTIRISARWQRDGAADCVRFEVTDSGPGIPESRLEDIFEAFRQVDGSHTRRHGGAGLGLAISRGIVNLHGGRIWAESRLGAGSTFVFLVPGEPAKQISATPERAQAGAQRCIVVVDDNEVELDLTRMVLENGGFSAVAVSRATEVLETVRRHQPMCVMLDVMMPEVSGITLLKELKAHAETRDIPVVVVTAYHDNEPLVRKQGGLWLPKPWEFQDLLNMLVRLRGEPVQKGAQ